MLPFFEEREFALSRVLTDRGTEYCGTDSHEYELYLALEDIDHTRTKVKSPQTNGICERFHKTVLNEFYRVAFRKKIFASLNELQTDLDAWLRLYNRATTPPGQMVLWENSDADIHRSHTTRQREDDCGVRGGINDN